MPRKLAYDCDVLVIGGGIVGLSTACAITRSAPGTRVTVLENGPDPARHRTGPGSGVIHSGIHHRPGSLTARYTVRGAAEMLKFCAEYDIAHAVTGKLIVATERTELPRLHALVQRGRENGVPVRELGTAQITEYEPQVRGLAAIHVATTGICDVAALARQLAEVSGAEIRYGTRAVRAVRLPGRGVAVLTGTGEEVRGRVLVDCAGPDHDETAGGESYELARPELVRGLVHPVPEGASPSLKVRLTRRIDGGVHIGARAEPGRPLSRAAFTAAVRRLLPAVTEDDLIPAAAGAQAGPGDGTPADDLLIHQGERTVHVRNAPSPAATAALPIGREAARRALAALTADG